MWQCHHWHCHRWQRHHWPSQIPFWWPFVFNRATIGSHCRFISFCEIPNTTDPMSTDPKRDRSHLHGSHVHRIPCAPDPVCTGSHVHRIHAPQVIRKKGVLELQRPIVALDALLRTICMGASAGIESHSMDPTSWIPHHGSHSMDPTEWIPQNGSHRMDPTAWIPQHGSHIMDPTSWIPHHGSHIMDPTVWIPHHMDPTLPSSYILDP